MLIRLYLDRRPRREEQMDQHLLRHHKIDKISLHFHQKNKQHESSYFHHYMSKVHSRRR